MRYVGHGLDIERQQVGVADRLRVDELRLRCDRLAYAFRRRLAEIDLDPHLRQSVLELVVRSAIETGCRDDLVAGVGDVQNGKGLRRLTGRGGKRADSALQRRDALLQHVGGRVHDPRVDIPECLETEQAGRMLRALEYV